MRGGLSVSGRRQPTDLDAAGAVSHTPQTFHDRFEPRPARALTGKDKCVVAGGKSKARVPPQRFSRTALRAGSSTPCDYVRGRKQGRVRTGPGELATNQRSPLLADMNSPGAFARLLRESPRVCVGVSDVCT
jgi:hypothetical protein